MLPFLACTLTAAPPATAIDADGDGYNAGEGADCNDDNPDIHPDAVEVCNSVDDDCDGAVDGPDSSDTLTFFADADGDGYGVPSPTLSECSQPEGYVPTADDCDDTDATVHPDADEHCNDLDDDCDGTVDEDAIDPPVVFEDTDGDTFGTTQLVACDAVGAAQGGDCDDSDASVNPASTETCDGTDSNCSGDESDSTDAPTWYTDADGDGFGDGARVACDAPDGTTGTPGDCDDSDDDVHPDAYEVCHNGVDDDCDATANGCGMTGPVTKDVVVTADYGVGTYGLATGDITGDGVGDIAIGQPGIVSSTGQVVIFDGPITSAPAIDTHITGSATGERAGTLLAADGSFDGDTTADLAYSSPNAEGNKGAIHLFLGPVVDEAHSADFDLRVVGESVNDLVGSSDGVGISNSLSLAGDMNGDGSDDLAFGGENANTNGDSSGAAWVVFGGVTGEIDASACDLEVAGAAGDYAGTSVGWLGDVDGDGYAELIVGGSGDATRGESAGAAWLIDGTTRGSVTVASAEATWWGAAGEQAGYTVAGPGDLTGDAVPDVIVGGYGAKAWLVEGTSGTMDLVDAYATFDDDGSVSGVGYGAAGADLDGDGDADLVLAGEGAQGIWYGPIAAGDHLLTSGADAWMTGIQGYQLAIGDASGDGEADVLAGLGTLYDSAWLYFGGGI